MFNSIAIQICSLTYVTMLIIVYLYKRKYDTLTNHIYKHLLINTIFLLILDIMAIIIIENYPTQILIKTLFTKGFFLSIILWFMYFLLYVTLCEYFKKFINFKNAIKETIGIKLWLATLIILLATVIYLPISFTENQAFISGLGVTFTYIASIIILTISLIILIINKNKITPNRKIPLIIFIILILIVYSFQFIQKDLPFISSILALVTVFMYFILVNPDITYIDELNELRETAENANKAKTEFLASMSHEIRTPMNAILGLTDSVLTNELPSSVKEDIQNINNAGQILLEIINNILDISKIEEGKMELVNTTYNISNIIQELTNIITVRIGEKPIKFTTNIDQKTPSKLFGDETKIFQICLNLLNNAAKYTDRGEINFQLTTRIFNDLAYLTINVTDTGRGIKKEDYDKLFEKFTRLDKEVNQTIEGTGLGLVITKEMVNLMEGKISFTSEYGKGSTFTVVIPQKIIDYNPIGTINELSFQQKEINYFNGSNYKILIVDDNKLNLKVAEKLLKPYNFQITTVDSGLACLNYTKKTKYDLIFLDHMMPEMDGIQTLSYLKQRVDFVNTPIIALTANAISGMKEMYLKAGFDDYLSKPIDQTKLNEILIKHLKINNQIDWQNNNI